ncbi:MAG: hypothetical protein EON47_01920 [Acetobacteraceae bacterium]|nr:MAG: hypothetical protein EON47_01920 [Acetobacteraceae bacterium]
MADGYFSNLRSRAEDVRDSAGKYGRDARDSAEKYGRRASSSLRDAGETIRDRGDDARGELAKLWNDLEDLVERRISPAAQDAARYAGSYARDGRDAALDMASQLRDATRSRPLMAIGIAVAATWVISTMLRSSKR